MKRLLLLLAVITLVSMTAVTAQAQLASVKVDLSGPGVVPPSASAATGSGCFVEAATGGLNMDYVIEYTGLEGTENFAGIYNSGVLHTTLALGTPKAGILMLADLSELSQLAAGNFSVRIDTDLYPNGELGGPILNQECVPVSNDEQTWGTLKSRYNED